MLLHLFEMQDRNSAWASLCLKQRSDEIQDTKNSLSRIQNYNTSALNCSDTMGARASLDYVHKHPELDSSGGEQNLSRRQLPSCLSHLCKAFPLSTSPNKSDNPSNSRYQDLANIMSFNNQVTRSEPNTRSNSVDCDKDQICSNLPAADPISRNRELDMSRISDLTIPTCKQYIKCLIALCANNYKFSSQAISHFFVQYRWTALRLEKSIYLRGANHPQPLRSTPIHPVLTMTKFLSLNSCSNVWNFPPPTTQPFALLI